MPIFEEPGASGPISSPGIFHSHFLFFEVSQSLAQRLHVRQVERQVVQRFRRRATFLQCDRDVVIANRDTVLKFELLR